MKWLYIGLLVGSAVIFFVAGWVHIAKQIEEKRWWKHIDKHMKIDRNGHPLMKGDRVRCDGSDTGRIQKFGDNIALVQMDFGGQVMDWPLRQLEFIKDDEVGG